jgi:hypothetical protein
MKRYKTIFSEAGKDVDFQKRFGQFAIGLQNLTNKTGIAIRVFGNVHDVKGDKVQYDNDYTSGDINF